jgi:hypothetical protein
MPNTPNFPTGNNAAAALEGAAALFSIASDLAALFEATDRSANGRPSPAEIRAQRGVQCRDENSQALGLLRSGDFRRAAVVFQRAAEDCYLSDDANSDQEEKANLRNANLANAEDMLDQGWRAEQRGDLRAANKFYLQGKQAADAATAPELANKIGAYNDRIVAKAGGANSDIAPTGSSCSYVNGQLLCR